MTNKKLRDPPMIPFAPKSRPTRNQRRPRVNWVRHGDKQSKGECVINCDSRLTLPKEALVERVGILGSSKLRQLDDALRFALGLEND